MRISQQAKIANKEEQDEELRLRHAVGDGGVEYSWC